jgi:hypothetical protein
MVYNISSSLYIIGTLGTIIYIYNWNLNKNLHKRSLKNITNKVEVKNVEVQTVCPQVEFKLFIDKAIQCERDICDLEDKGEIEILQAPTSNYRWIMVKLLGK